MTGSRWVGMDDVMRELTGMVARAQGGARQALVGGAAIVEDLAKRNFQGHHAKGQPHIGGRGSYPNVVTGTLRRSITHTPVVEVGLATFATTVGPTARYGRRVELEYGYAFFAPAREKAEPLIETYSLSVWNRVRG